MTHPIGQPYPNEYTRNVFPVTDTSMLFISVWKIYALNQSDDIAQPILSSEKIKSGFKIKDELFFISESNEFFQYNRRNKNLEPAQFSRPGIIGNKPMYFFWESGMKDPIMISGNNAWLLDYDGAAIHTREICNMVP